MLRQGIFGCVITKMCNSPLVAMVKNVYSNSKTIKPNSVKGKGNWLLWKLHENMIS